MGTWRVLTNIYFKCLFFFYCSSLCGLHLFTGGEGQTEGLGVKSIFIFLPWGLWEWGVQNKFEHKNRGGGGSSPDYFFSNVRIRQEGGIVQAN